MSDNETEPEFPPSSEEEKVVEVANKTKMSKKHNRNEGLSSRADNSTGKRESDGDSNSNSNSRESKDEGKYTEKVPTGFSSATSSSGPEENVRVVVRVRPMSKSEIERQYRDIIVVDKDTNSIELKTADDDVSVKCFRFDTVFAPDTSQADVYNLVARPIVQNVIEGYNGTIFAYGQTGTGKTYTMEGDTNVPEMKGIIPNSFAQIFSHISNASGERRFLVRVSYLEIYNEEVRDLLKKEANQKLEVRERTESGVYVKGLSSFVVRNADEMDDIMRNGNIHRSVGATDMNDFSSRSHAIFTISVEASIENDDGSLKSIRMGKLNLVDLAGSERISKTGATGQRLKEGAKINLSLSCLGNVISALVEGHSHIPYRTSKLTRLLQDSLGGNSKTVMCANIGPADYNYDETLSTLRYADRAKHIRNHARINEDPKDALLRQFQNEIEQLRRQLQEDSFDSGEKFRNREDEDVDKSSGNEDEDEEPYPSDISYWPSPHQDTIEGIRGELMTQEQLASNIQEDANARINAMLALKDSVETWESHKEKRDGLVEKLRSIKRKIMVGGENLLDKSQQQEEYLQRSMLELDQRKKKELKLQNTLTSKQVEREQSEGRILTLQAESASLNKKLRKCYKQYLKEKAELDSLTEDCEADDQKIHEDIFRSTKELKFMNHVINEMIPSSYQELIEKHCTWNEDTGSWALPAIAYTGNHIHHTTTHSQSRHYHHPPTRKLKDLSFLQPSLFEASPSSSVDESGDHRSKRGDLERERLFQNSTNMSNNCPGIIFTGDTHTTPRRRKQKTSTESLRSARSPPSH